MGIAAVPDYLGKDFSQASPGLRFGPYFKVWRSLTTASIDPNAKHEALAAAAILNDADDRCMKALIARQEALAALQPLGTVLTLDAVAVAPFMTGLGLEHPLENGFAFLQPYGLPYLPGSGVKGVLRQAARELASGDWGETAGWDAAAIAALFGDAPSATATAADSARRRGALMFWDVVPAIPGKRLALDIMTPHQTDYYQSGDAPHDSGQPNPVIFLAVPPKARFCFHVQCRPDLLGAVHPELLAFSDRLTQDVANKGRGPGCDLWKGLAELVSSAEDWSDPRREQLRELVQRAFVHMGVDRKKAKAAKTLWAQVQDK